MSIRQIADEVDITDTLSVVTVAVTEPGVGLHHVYEVHCSECDVVDQYDQRSAAETYGPAEHRCQVPR